MDQANKLRDIVKQKESDVPAPRQNLSARVITITSGKGGVGKTNFAVNLAIQLSKQNKRVVIIDTDFGLANIEVLFGIIPKYSFADVILGNKTIDEVITNGPVGIKFVSGGSGLGELANITEKQMSYIIESFILLDSMSDIILIDTGAGISKTVVNFIKASSETIIITTPEPTSITDAYAIVKTVKEENTYIPDFKIVVNRVDDVREGTDIYEKLNKVTQRFLNITLQPLGHIPYDPSLIKAVKRQEPVAISFPNSEATKAIDEISKKILNIEVASKSSSDGIMSFMKRLVSIFNN